MGSEMCIRDRFIKGFNRLELMLVISPLTFHWYVANEALEIASNDDDKLLYSNVTSKYSQVPLSIVALAL